MAGYVRNDTPNNIADGNVINAADLDGEFDSLQTAFGAASGHSHSGAAGEGKPIEKLGPAQDFVVSISAATPKTTNTLDLGATSFKFKDGFFAGKVDTGTITLGGTAVTSSAAELNLLDGVTATTVELNLLDGVTASTTELNYVTGVTSSIQTQLGTKQATITGAASTVVSSNLTADYAVVSDATGKIAVHPTVTSTELGYLDGVTSALQTQLGTKQATITGAATTITSSDLTASRALASSASGKVVVSTVTDTELGYVSGVTSAIQTQLGTKQATITGAATTIASSNLTASRALASDVSGKVAVSAVTSTELGYVSGVTSAIQTQLGNKAPLASPALTGNPTITSNSTTPALTVSQAGTGAAFLVEDTASIDGTPFIIDNSGQVGIGLLAPSQRLHVNGAVQIDERALITGNLEVGTSLLYANPTTGFVGVGTNGPNYKLDVAGTANMTTLSIGGTAITSTAAELNILDGIPATLTAIELGYSDGVTSSIQTQLNGKAPLTGTGTSGTWPISISGDAASVDGKSFGTFTAAGGIAYATSTTALAVIAAGTVGQALLSGNSGAPTWGYPEKLSTASGSAPSYSCRAWVNFNGTGTVAIRASGNVSSITDNGTGVYTVNFTTSMPDANYTIHGTVNGNSRIMSINTQAAGSSQIQTRYTPSNVAQDCDYVDVAVFC
jgi:hypothetical protein